MSVACGLREVVGQFETGKGTTRSAVPISEHPPHARTLCRCLREKVMEQRVSLITLGVRDLDQSRAFYERLGWRRSALNADEVAFFQVGGLVLSLVPRANLAKDAALSPAGSGFCGMVLAYNTRTKEVDGGR